MKLNIVKHAFVILLAGAMLFPVSFANVDTGAPFLSRAFALSSDTMPLSSNLFVEIAKKQNPAVVNVSAKTKPKSVTRQFRPPSQREKGAPDPFKDFYDRFFGQRPDQRPRGGTGSGFIIDPEGFILTNFHVVEGAEEINVTLEDDKEYTAELIGSDSKTDIALIKISRENGGKKPFPFLKLVNSEKLEAQGPVLVPGKMAAGGFRLPRCLEYQPGDHSRRGIVPSHSLSGAQCQRQLASGGATPESAKRPLAQRRESQALTSVGAHGNSRARTLAHISSGA